MTFSPGSGDDLARGRGRCGGWQRFGGGGSDAARWKVKKCRDCEGGCVFLGDLNPRKTTFLENLTCRSQIMGYGAF